jgi:hypothetical protein
LRAIDEVVLAQRFILVGAQKRSDVRASIGEAVPNAEVRSAADDDRFTFDSLELLVSIIRTILLAFAGVAVLVGAFTIFKLALDHRRASHEGARAAADGRRGAPAPSLAAVAIIAALAGMVAAALPARRAARIDVLKALAYE